MQSVLSSSASLQAACDSLQRHCPISLRAEVGLQEWWQLWGGAVAVSRKEELLEFAARLSSEAGGCISLQPVLSLLAGHQTWHWEDEGTGKLSWTSSGSSPAREL